MQGDLTGGAKPRLVFFQWDHHANTGASTFLALHMKHHVKCLAQYFDVHVVSEDCDYGEVCDRLAPDLALFEAGYRTHGSRRVRITGTDAHSHVPKLALHNGDPWCDRRSGLLADMDRWGIETVFTIGTAMPGYTPSIADRTFVWPNFIDPEVFHDRGFERVIPVMVTGQSYGLYPWREAVHGTLTRHYPCLVTPPFRYEDSGAQRMLAGESYARALNASWISPSCGTMGQELVRKHLEIPGSGCLLLAERIPVLEAAGFVDGKNCVFAEPAEVLDKVDALLGDKDRLREIAAAGNALVHARHTLAHRPQIREWYELNRTLPAGHRIVQPGPFDRLTTVAETHWSGHGHLPAAGLDRAAIARGDQCLERRDFEGARAAYGAALDLVSYLPEARFGLARCALEEGRAADALDGLAGLIETSVIDYGAESPDPVDWAYYLVALVAAGRRATAVALRSAYPDADHAELRHIQAVLAEIAGGGEPSFDRAPPRGTSVHAVPERSAEAHREWLEGLLRRNGQQPLKTRRAVPDVGSAALGLLHRVLGGLGGDAIRPPLPPGPGLRYFVHLRNAVGRKLLSPRARRLARQIVARMAGQPDGRALRR